MNDNAVSCIDRTLERVYASMSTQKELTKHIIERIDNIENMVKDTNKILAIILKQLMTVEVDDGK